MENELGCMNGIFQLFGRRTLLPGRQATGIKQKSSAPGQLIKHGMEQDGTMQRTQENILKQVGKEKTMSTVEPSRSSLPSSCSSCTPSSTEYSKKTESEPSSSYQSMFPEATSRPLPMKNPSTPLMLSWQSFHLREIVKEPTYRETRGLSVKTVGKEKGERPAIKHIDSPRPLHVQKAVRPKISRNDGSPRIPVKLRDRPCSAREQKHSSLPLPLTDAPRYSYDERESQGKRKSTANFKELPRLSLDSRERSIRSNASQPRSTYAPRELHRDMVTVFSDQSPNLGKGPGSNKRPSAIVAKLMGLESVSDFIPKNMGHMMKIESCLNEDSDTITRSTRICNDGNQNKVSGFSRITSQILVSPTSKNDNLAIKSTLSSRFLRETAPSWRRTESNQCSHKQESKYCEDCKKSPHASPSVYGEIEKRLSELEFKRSGKDLRALKQILEAMEKTKERLANKKEQQISDSKSHTNKCSTYSSDQASTEKSQINNPVSTIIKGSSSPRRNGPPRVIAKPFNMKYEKRANPTKRKTGAEKKWSGDIADNMDLVDEQRARDITIRKSNPRVSSSEPQTPIKEKTNAGNLRSPYHPKLPMQNIGSFGRFSGNLSPCLQQKKHGMEKLSRLTTQPPDLRRGRKQSIKQQIIPGYITNKVKPKSTRLQQEDDQLTFSSNDARRLSHHGDTLSMQSESGISLASEIDTEVTSTDHTKQITGNFQSEDPNDDDFKAKMVKERSITKVVAAKPEQPSPVSVLDTTFYEEDSLSPVKKLTSVFQDYDALHSDEADWRTVYIDHLHNSRRPNPSSKFDHRNLEHIDNYHKFQLVNSDQEEATTNHTGSGNNIISGNRCIANILVAADPLTDLGSSIKNIQSHPSRFSTDPSLFHVMEKEIENTKLAEKHSEKCAQPKLQRKLIFDIVASKSALAGLTEPWLFPKKMGLESMNPEKLLEELYSKMNHQATPDSNLDGQDDSITTILRADMMNEPENWVVCSCELPGLVLDIERLIIKDLIVEIVSDGGTGLQMQPRRHSRKLF